MHQFYAPLKNPVGLPFWDWQWIWERGLANSVPSSRDMSSHHVIPNGSIYSPEDQNPTLVLQISPSCALKFVLLLENIGAWLIFMVNEPSESHGSSSDCQRMVRIRINPWNKGLQPRLALKCGVYQSWWRHGPSPNWTPLDHDKTLSFLRRTTEICFDTPRSEAATWTSAWGSRSVCFLRYLDCLCRFYSVWSFNGFSCPWNFCWTRIQGGWRTISYWPNQAKSA